MYSQLVRRWKLGPFAGEGFKATNGILQGCPLSVTLLNMFMHVWVATIKAETDDCRPAAFADDLGVNSPTLGGIASSLAITQEFAALTGGGASGQEKGKAAAGQQPQRSGKICGHTWQPITIV